MRQILFFVFFISLGTTAYTNPFSSIVTQDPNGGGTRDTICLNEESFFDVSGSIFTDSLVIDWGDGSPLETYTTNPFILSHLFSATSLVTLVTYDGALTDTARILLVVLQLPQPRFAFSYNPLACFTKAGIQVSFTDSSSGGSPPYAYTWYFGDGSSDTAKNPVHTYYAPGKYIITLTTGLKNISAALSCQLEYYVDSLEIIADSTVVSAMNAAADCPCNKIFFTAAGNATSWHWNFGDGDTSNLQNPSHLYREPGQYVVAVNGTSSTGCYFQKKLPLTVCNGDTLPVSKSNNRWYFGGSTLSNPTFDAAGIDFNPAAPVPLTNGNLAATEGCATMNDADNGNLLFYTNGSKVWDNTHAVMSNGTGLFGGLSTSQSCLIVPFPGNRNQYYIITANGFTDTQRGYYYSIVDMTQNGGRGAIISKNNVFFIGACPEAQVYNVANVVAHEALTGTVNNKGDCTRPAEYWVIIPACKDTFKTFLITSTGISPPVTTVAPDDNYNGAGYSCVSPDGTKYAISQYGNTGTNKIRLFDFNKQTGLLSNEKHLFYSPTFSWNENFYGLAFSPNSSVLYAPFGNKLYQWNLNSINISGSLYRVVFPGADMWGSYLGPDGKIYVASAYTRTSISVINNPDVLGAGCNLTPHSFFLGGRNSRYGLQNIIPLAPQDTFSLNASFTATQDSCSYQVSFTDSSCRFMPDSVSVQWDYGDGTIANFNTLQYPDHTYLNAGTYPVKLVLSKGCYKSDSIIKQVTITPALTFSVATTPSSCGNANGTATANASGGTGAYTYSWSNSTTSQTASGLIASTYTVTTTDENGCSSTLTTNIINLNGPIITLSVSADILCNGDTGSLSASVAGGTGPYTYSWSSGTTTVSALTNQQHTGLLANNYSLVITDAYGCSNSNAINLTEPTLLGIPTFTTTKATCGQNNGTALVSSSGGTGTLLYNWSNGATGQAVNNLTANSYTVIVTDANGCSQTSAVTIDSIIAPSIVILSTINPLCNGLATGVATMSVSAGTAPYLYTWSSVGSTNTSATGLSAGTHIFTVRDSTNCQITQTVTITQPPPILINTNSTSSDCEVANGSATADASGGTGALSYTWSNGNTSASISALNPGTYSLTVTDINGCSQTTSVIVGQNNGPVADAGNNVVITRGGSATLTATGGGSYSWAPSTGLSCSTCQNPVATPEQTTTYYVIVTDNSGCTDVDSVIVTVDIICSEDIFIPNAFSPNGDGQNEILKVQNNNCIKTMSFIIYGRWGEKVFETTDINTGWNGTYNGKLMNTGVFTFIMIAELTNNDQVIKKGNISLVR